MIESQKSYLRLRTVFLLVNAKFRGNNEDSVQMASIIPITVNRHSLPKDKGKIEVSIRSKHITITKQGQLIVY